MNKFGDLTKEEFSALRLGGFSPKKQKNYNLPLDDNIPLPSYWNWADKGAVTKVIEEQGQCGSCWAFSTTGTVESCHFINTGKLIRLSAQDLVDCDTVDQGCNGGLMDNAYQYIISNGGIDAESCYPYTALDGTCHYNSSCCASTVTSFVDVPSGNENALQLAVYKTPVAIGVDAVDWQTYSGGVFYDPSCTSDELDHSAVIIGWGVDNGTDYWIVKNSWGSDWGIHGYIWLARNRNNNCGVATEASYPLGCFDCKH